MRLFGTGCVLVGCLEVGPAIFASPPPLFAPKVDGFGPGSARRYELQCDPATDEETLALLGERLAIGGHFAFDDVTQEFLAGTLQVEPC